MLRVILPGDELKTKKIDFTQCVTPTLLWRTTRHSRTLRKLSHYQNDLRSRINDKTLPEVQRSQGIDSIS